MEPGSLIADRYRLDDSIGSGGMGSVWRAFDTRLKRAVAVKILRSGFESDDAARARFEHEAQAVASLRHNGIAALHDFGETVDDRGATISYLVMELIEGRSLTSRLLDGPMEPAEAMRLCAQVAEALQCAHEAGIIHRDVKPANIMLDERGRAVLVDFGIALSAGRMTITESGVLLGTLYYASPEQLEGRELTTATDVYSLGAVAYECLAGTPPFTGDTAGAILNGHLNQPPPQFPEAVPPAPAAAVFQALAKSPDSRWPTAAAFAEAASQAAANPDAPHADPAQFAVAQSPAMPVATGPHPFTPPSDPTPPPRPAKRKRLWVILPAAAVAIVAAVAALMLSPWLSQAGDGAGGERGTIEAQESMESAGELPGGAGATTPDGTASDTSSAASDENDDEAPENGGTGGGGAEETGGDDNGGDSGGGDEATEEATEDEGGMEPGSPPLLPDVVGMNWADAEDRLNEEGWTNTVVVADSAEPENGVAECGVYSQSPEGETETDYDTQVFLYYWEIEPGTC